MSSQPKSVREISAKWDDVLLVCRKCSRKVHGGFGKKDGQRLEKALKSELKGRGRYKVVSVPCLDICPKNAVCLVQASEPGKVRLVAPGTDMEDIVGGLAPLPSPARERGGKASRRVREGDAAPNPPGDVASPETR